MSQESEAKIRQWRRQIDECRREAKGQPPDGREALHSMIRSYEALIALVRCQVEKARKPTASAGDIISSQEL
jgi:hypothetical protein